MMDLRMCVVTISASCQHPAVLTVSTQTKQNLQKDTHKIEGGSKIMRHPSNNIGEVCLEKKKKDEIESKKKKRPAICCSFHLVCLSVMEFCSHGHMGVVREQVEGPERPGVLESCRGTKLLSHSTQDTQTQRKTLNSAGI